MSNVDIIILGGGPAGSAAAIHAIQQGLKVCIIERQSFPRLRPGETLPPGAEPLFKQLGVLDAIEKEKFVRHSGIYVKWKDSKLEFQPYQKDAEKKETWYGYQAYRPVLDNILLKQAKQLGAHVIIAQDSEEFIFFENSKKIQRVNVDGNILSSSFIIDATGSWHFLARKLDIPMDVYSKRLYTRYGYAEGKLPGCDGIPQLIADKEGWTWTALIRRGLYQWTRLNFKEKRVSPDWLPESFKSLKPCEKSKGADVTWRIVSEPAGEGYFITGDAAVVLDPASSHGVLRALMTGIKAADLAANVIFKVCDEGVAIQEYNRWLFEWCQHDIQNLHRLYMEIGQNVWQFEGTKKKVSFFS